MPTPADIITALYPTAVDGATLAVILPLAEARTSASAFGASRNEAVAYLAMHMLDLKARGGSGMISGPIVSESEGGLSRTYAQPQSTIISEYSATGWGQQLLALWRGSIFGPSIGGVTT